MKPIVITPEVIRLIAELGIARAAKKLGRRYGTLREAATAAGLNIKRGRPREKLIAKRNKRIIVMRKNKLLLREIGQKFGIGRERVRQILTEQRLTRTFDTAWKEAAGIPSGAVLKPAVTAKPRTPPVPRPKTAVLKS